MSDTEEKNTNGKYYWSLTPAWSAVGASLAKWPVATTASSDMTCITITKPKPIRTYYRLKLFIDDILDDADIDTIDSKYRADEQIQYNTLISSDIIDNVNRACSFTEKNWKKTRLVQLYKKSAKKHNDVVDKYKRGDKICFDAGFDLYYPSYSSFERFGDGTKKLDHCVKCSMDKVKTDKDGNEECNPVGYYLYPRSSIATNTPLSLSNSVGIIDSGYRGNIISAFHSSRSTDKYIVTLYQRLVQICPPDISYPVEVVIVDNKEELGNSTRDEAGFGSTGV